MSRMGRAYPAGAKVYRTYIPIDQLSSIPQVSEDTGSFVDSEVISVSLSASDAGSAGENTNLLMLPEYYTIIDIFLSV